MTRTGIALIVCVIALATLAGAAHRTALSDAGQGAPPLTAITGPTTAVRERGWRRLSTQEALDTLWAEHAGTARQHVSPLSVDFDRCVVLAYFEPGSINASGVRVESIDTPERGLRVRYNIVRYQTATFGDKPDAGVPAAPFGFFVIDRYDGPISFEENTQGTIGAPPEWTERWFMRALSAPSQMAEGSRKAEQ